MNTLTHTEALAAFATGKKLQHHFSGDWYDIPGAATLVTVMHEQHPIRLKPSTKNLMGHIIPLPIDPSEKIEKDTLVYIPDLTSESHFMAAIYSPNSLWDTDMHQRGLLYKTSEDAIKVTKTLLEILK